MLKHYLKHASADDNGDEARSKRQQLDIERLHPKLDKILTAVLRVEKRLGLAYEPNEAEI